MPQFNPKQAVFATLADIAQAIGHPNRLELLDYLAQGQRSVEALSILSGMRFANTSRHLQILRRARLVNTERQGKHVLYSLNNDTAITNLLQALNTVGECNHAEVQRIMQDFFAHRGNLHGMSQQALLAQLKDGTVTLLDVRPEHEFANGHLPGALNIPLATLEKQLSLLPENQDIVAYCRGPYCVLSVEAVALLRARGFNAHRLENGFLDWKARGLSVEVSPA